MTSDREVAYLRPRAVRPVSFGGQAADQMYASVGRSALGSPVPEGFFGKVTYPSKPKPPSYAALAWSAQRRIDDAYRARRFGVAWSRLDCGESPDTPHLAPPGSGIEHQFRECMFCGASLHGCEACGPADGFIRWGDAE